ncbi:MAG: efflux RND transporter periplasmic adaptor subunit, partial [Gammaproteobacteria bacterium]|nr:efflux RND transporter periplasmic adaptor subunit [Gammaproteobacteria bacterium]
MTISMKTLASVLFMGAIVGAGGVWLAVAPKSATQIASPDPLYWVAPMDPNYRRDTPGKSPMGMDLVPVYATDDAQGMVSISPVVENNLGVRT